MKSALALSDRTPGKKFTRKYEADLGSPLRALSVTILIYLAIQVVLLAVTIVFITVHHDKNYSLDKSAPAEFLVILVAEALTVFFILNILKKRRLSLASIGLGRRPALRDFWKGLLAFAIFFFAFFGVAAIIYSFSPHITNQKQDV